MAAEAVKPAQHPLASLDVAATCVGELAGTGAAGTTDHTQSLIWFSKLDCVAATRGDERKCHQQHE